MKSLRPANDAHGDVFFPLDDGLADACWKLVPDIIDPLGANSLGGLHGMVLRGEAVA